VFDSLVVHWPQGFNGWADLVVIVGFTISAVAYIKRQLVDPIRNIAKKGDEILYATKANGLNSDTTGDSSKRTEIKVDALLAQLAEHRRAVEERLNAVEEHIGLKPEAA